MPASPGTSQPARNAFGNPPPTVFESPDSDQWQRPEWVIDQLDLEPGFVVAHIGAGSGYFSRRIAKRLTDGGRVMAVDVDPGMLAFLTRKAKAEGVSNIDTRREEPDAPPLAPESVDLIFLTNTLHHIPNRETYYPQLIAGLKPGGRIVNIDFYKRELPVGPRDLDHKLAKSVVLKEFANAQLNVTHDLTGLANQYFLIAEPLPPIQNAILLDARTVSAGKPTDAQLAKMAKLGFRTVLNLQTKREGRIVKDLGLAYVNIPIVSNEITQDQIQRFSETLTKTDNYPMLIHCRSGGHVGGMILLHEVLRQNTELETALKEARRAGLKPLLERLLLQQISAER